MNGSNLPSQPTQPTRKQVRKLVRSQQKHRRTYDDDDDDVGFPQFPPSEGPKPRPGG